MSETVYPDDDLAYEAWRDEGRAEELFGPKGWECWTLYPDDIAEMAEQLGFAPERLSKDQMEDIALSFRKGFQASASNWKASLKIAIEAVVG